MALPREQTLIKQLEEQGIRVEKKQDGTGFTAYGKTNGTNPSGIVQIHSSSLRGERSPIVAVLSELRKIGYKPTGEERKLEGGQHAAERMTKIVCGIDGCTKKSYPGPMGQHRKSAHKKWWAEHTGQTVQRATGEERVVKPRRQAPVRIRQQEPKSEAEKAKLIVARLQRALDILHEALPEIVTLVGTLETERDEMKRRLARLTKTLGEAVDIL